MIEVLHKGKEDTSEFKNYKDISLLSAVGKVYQRIIIN